MSEAAGGETANAALALMEKVLFLLISETT